VRGSDQPADARQAVDFTDPAHPWRTRNRTWQGRGRAATRNALIRTSHQIHVEEKGEVLEASGGFGSGNGTIRGGGATAELRAPPIRRCAIHRHRFYGAPRMVPETKIELALMIGDEQDGRSISRRRTGLRFEGTRPRSGGLSPRALARSL